MEELSFMSWFRRFTCFQFDKHDTSDYQISIVGAYCLSVEPNRNGSLLPEFNPSFLKRDNHCFFVYFFKKAKPELVINVVENADNLLGQF